MSIDNATKREWDEARRGVEWDQEIDRLPINNQVGGNHYNHLKIQPIEYAYANNLSPCLTDVVQYITRSKGEEKDRIRDLMKAKHSIDLELQLVYGCDKDGNRIGKYTKEISI
jgi:hypothetical protein|tara:strand:+ start:128 stop:466 length:339 start_codon:yes stop_codon:yes gene_type:complete